MRRPRFSIVIPTRERPRTLKATLATCLDQEIDGVLAGGRESGKLSAEGRFNFRWVGRERAHEFDGPPLAIFLLRHGSGVHQRRPRAQVQGDLRTFHQPQNVKHVFGPLQRPQIAGNHRQSEQLDLPRPLEQHRQRGSVVAEKGAVRVEDDLLRLGQRELDYAQD